MCTVKTPDDGTRNCPQHVEFYSKNKFEKLVHLVGFIIRIQFIVDIFGPRRNEVTGEWWRLHNEDLNDLYSSPNIVRMIKSRRMRWTGHVARMGEERRVYRVLVGKP